MTNPVLKTLVPAITLSIIFTKAMQAQETIVPTQNETTQQNTESEPDKQFKEADLVIMYEPGKVDDFSAGVSNIDHTSINYFLVQYTQNGTATGKLPKSMHLFKNHELETVARISTNRRRLVVVTMWPQYKAKSAKFTKMISNIESIMKSVGFEKVIFQFRGGYFVSTFRQTRF